MQEDSQHEALRLLRAQIDALDEQILGLISERGRLAQAVGHLKDGIIYKPEREAQVVARLQALNPGPLTPDALVAVFREIMSACRALEQQLSVAYLGPAGTFSEAATVKHFGHAVRGMPCDCIDEVFRSVERGEAHYGVVPVENSTEGAISRTLDLMLETRLNICGEVLLRVRQQLMRKLPTLTGIQVVYSHAQSLAQCHTWLTKHLPGVKTVPVSSNAEAARLAAEDPHAAALGSALAAERYDLRIIARDVEDDTHNTTRFLVMGRENVTASGRDKTSLVLSVHNRPGALLDVLAPLAERGIGLSKLESRPARNGAWEYVFYLDLDGHRDSAHIQAALADLGTRCAFLKVLGAYPRA
ncbi:MAG TPA: prephenate dehydratase [Thiobacillaceae bacterium]|nr:prephenate dehydratase [Thiobacillaceae bacterium]HNU63551.1 prephenate dehydratase [Thiobacillaceae bacterium]